MPSQSEFKDLMGQSLSRRDLLLLGTAGAATHFGLSRQDARADNLIQPLGDMFIRDEASSILSSPDLIFSLSDPSPPQ